MYRLGSHTGHSWSVNDPSLPGVSDKTGSDPLKLREPGPNTSLAHYNPKKNLYRGTNSGASRGHCLPNTDGNHVPSKENGISTPIVGNEDISHNKSCSCYPPPCAFAPTER